MIFCRFRLCPYLLRTHPQFLQSRYKRSDHFHEPVLSSSQPENGGWFWIVLCILMVVLAKISGEKCSIKNENCSRAVIGRAGWYGLLSMGAGALITNVCLKNLVARPRPYEVVEGLVPLIGKPTDYSFPSGHTCASFACALVLYRILPKKYGVPAVILASLIAFSRLYVGVHYPTDVLGGMFVGIFSSCLVLWIGKKRTKK